MASQGEKIVVDANGFNPKYMRPDTCQEFFCGGARGNKRLAQCWPCLVRRWERLAVYFAIRCQGQCVEHYKSRWDHVVGQFCLQETTQLVEIRAVLRQTTVRHQAFDRRECPPAPGRRPVVWLDVAPVLSRSPPVQYGTRGSSLGGQYARETRCCRPAGNGPGPQSCRAVRLAALLKGCGMNRSAVSSGRLR